MIIKTREQIPIEEMIERHGVKKELVIGEYDDSCQLVLRMLSIEPMNELSASAGTADKQNRNRIESEKYG